MRIAIAGCGIAGMAAALLLYRDGHDVTLFERFAAPQPVGSGLMLQPTGQAVLDQLGLLKGAIARGARIERLVGETPRGRTVLDVRYAALGGRAFGIGIHRASLFELLHDAVLAAGIPIERGRAVSGTREGRLVFEADESARFDLIVDALGARSVLVGEPARPLAYGALWASLDWRDGFDPSALQQRYRAASVMAGVLPIGEGQAAFFWSLRGDRLETWRAAGLAAWKADVAALWPATIPLLVQIISPDQLTFAHYAHRTLAWPVTPGMIHIGDAWHSTSPQLGQGANMALLDAWALAMAQRAGDPALLVRLRRGHVRLYQAMSAAFTPVYQSDGRMLPALRDWLVGPLSKLWPATALQAAMVSGTVGWPLARLGLGDLRSS